jgi:hypothetical protein
VMLEASCCCGALRVKVIGDPVLNGVCHCSNCKRRTGSSFGWQCYFPEDAVSPPTGEPVRYDIASQSGAQQRYFCKVCGTTLYWRAAVFSGVVGIAAGCFPPGSIGAPTTSASDAGHCAWLGLPEGMTVYA